MVLYSTSRPRCVAVDLPLPQPVSCRMPFEHVDVLIVGAGLSGIGAAYHLQDRCPAKSYLILEGRDAIGGTWDLFRYPGVRSDSDMYTFGYAFQPWTGGESFADGPAIRAYIRGTAEAHGIDRKIRFQHRVVGAAWSSAEAQWTVDVEVGPEAQPARFTCGFLYTCTGYYDYEEGYAPTWPGMARYRGRIVHPQHWPDDLDYAEQRVLVIGSGATAVTLVPAMATEAAHVTMLQRSPTYVVAQPAQDAIADRLRRLLPERLAYGLIRWKNVLRSWFYYQLARRRPEGFRAAVMRRAQEALGPAVDVDPHFNPSYDPWDQRLCLAPDGDLFEALRAGRASIVTGHIETFTEAGVRLQSGQELEADLVVTATGLVLRLLSGITLTVDGEPVDLAQTMAYKGAMYSGVPNLTSAFGYTNASWTLKVDLTAAWVCRLLNYMDQHGWATVTPQRDPAQEEEPVIDFSSGYVQRALDQLPAQGAERPWRLHQNYALDLLDFRFSSVDDGALVFEAAAVPEKAASGDGRS